MTTTTKPHILIAGAGLGGLTLAQCLRAQNHPFTIFDRDASYSSRAQGWAIALHTILADLLAAAPDDMPSIESVNHLVPLQHLPAQLCFYDVREQTKRGMKFMVESKSKAESGYGYGRVIRANRDKLRGWLTNHIDVQWGKQVTGFEQDDNGVTVQFSDGTTARGDILVGAEGARSPIRDQLLPNAKLVNVPACFVTGETTLSKEQYERQLKLSHSSYVFMGDGFHVFVGLSNFNSDASSGHYYWDLIWHDPERAGSHWIDDASAQDLYDFTIEKTKNLDQRFTEIIRLTDPKNVKTPPLILRDLVLEKMPVSKVTLLGDAAHAMVPFQGEGGCHAIEDAIKLAKVLTEDGDLDVYQKEMLARGSKAVRASRAAGDQDERTQTHERKAWGQPVKFMGPAL